MSEHDPRKFFSGKFREAHGHSAKAPPLIQSVRAMTDKEWRRLEEDRLEKIKGFSADHSDPAPEQAKSFASAFFEAERKLLEGIVSNILATLLSKADDVVGESNSSPLSDVRPPAFAEWIYGVSLSPDEREAVLGDAADKYALWVGQGRGPMWRWSMYWADAIKSAVAYVMDNIVSKLPG